MMDAVKKFFVCAQKIQTEVDALILSFLKQNISFSKKIHPQAPDLFQEIQRSFAGGKRIRPTLVVIGYLAAGGKNLKAILPAAAAIELFHLYALIHDDIIDRSQLRRFKPTTVLFLQKKMRNEHLGLSAAILAGDLTRSSADALFLQCKVKDSVLKEALLMFALLKKEVELGQYLDLILPSKQSASLKDLMAILTYKTAKYSFERPLQIGAVLNNGSLKLKQELSRFALPLGISFQIQDDILGVFGKAKEVGKPIDSDIKEGKLTFLSWIAYAKASLKQKRALKRTLGNAQASKEATALVRQFFKDSGAYQKAKLKSLQLVARAKRCLNQSKSINQSGKLLLNGLTDYLANRRF